MTFKRKNNGNGAKFKRGNNGNGKNTTNEVKLKNGKSTNGNGKSTNGKNGNEKKKPKKEWEKILAKVSIEREEGYVTGRPTKYHPLYPSLAVAFLGDGHSKTALAAICDVDYTTLLDWESKHSEFSKGVKMGLVKGQRTWEDIGYNQCTDGKFNYQVYNLMMCNRFGYNSANNKVNLESNNVVEHKGGIKIDGDPKGRAAEILDILVQSGIFKSEIDKTSDSEDDEVHSTHSDD